MNIKANDVSNKIKINLGNSAAPLENAMSLLLLSNGHSKHN